MKNKKIITVLVLFLVVSAQAQGGVTDIIQGIGNLATAGLWGAVMDVVNEITTDTIYTYFIIKTFITPVKDALEPENFNNLLLQCNPELMGVTGNANPLVENKINFIIKLLLPFYFLAFLLLAIYLLLVSSSPIGRAKAKGSLLRLVLSVAFLWFTIPIIQALMDISLFFTKSVISTNPGNIEVALMTMRDAIGMPLVSGLVGHITRIMPLNFWLALPLLLFIAALSMLPFMVIGIRYFMIIIFTLLFPVGIFLYSIHFTRRLGTGIIRQAVLWIFTQPLMAIILSVTGIAAGPLLEFIPDSTMRTAFGLAGLIALSTAPLVMIGILNWIEVLLISVEAAMEVPLVHIIATTEELEVKE
jgi:hypothetical protein